MDAKNSEGWRFWPIILLATLYPINNVVVNLSIPLYFYKQGTAVALIGVLTASMALTYSFSPLLFNKLSDKLGRKNSIVLAMTGEIGRAHV